MIVELGESQPRSLPGWNVGLTALTLSSVRISTKIRMEDLLPNLIVWCESQPGLVPGLNGGSSVSDGIINPD